MKHSIPVDYVFNHILISAVRYALERNTYIVRMTCDYVTELLPRLNMLTLYAIERDILAQDSRGHGDSQDMERWIVLLAAVREEIDNRLKTESDIDSIR